MLFFDLFRNEPRLVNISAGDTLFREGDPGETMYVLLSGSADILVGERVVETVEAGGVVGELGVVETGPRSGTVRARMPCTFVEIDQARFRFLVEETPYFAVEVMKVMAGRLRCCDAHVHSLTVR